MTVAVLVKVWDGLVLASDSATTLKLDGGGAQVYNSANKIFHLHRQFPVALMTWGLGSIGSGSISTLSKDLRRRLMGRDDTHDGWELDPATYTIESVADRVVEHMFDELYAPTFHGQEDSPTLGLLVAGYSSGSGAGEAWLIEMTDPESRPVPVVSMPVDQGGWLAYAQTEALERLWNGIDRQTEALIANRVGQEVYGQVVADIVDGGRVRAPAVAAMPLADAIGLAEFMVNVTSGYTHFLLGPDTVGGPTEVASMSRHEGFRWINRKHYYDPRLNPRETNHDC